MAETGETAGADLRAEVSGMYWFHTIDLGNGVVTPGTPPNEVLERPGAFPKVRGRTVADIGSWDGKYAFRAEQEGASRVVAIDHYAWCVDFAQRHEYWQKCAADGVLPDPDYETKALWHPDTMPGRRGFDLAKQALGSAVEPVVGDFMTLDLDDLGVFDVVLYFGVLYHMREPLTALTRVRQITREMAAIETSAVRVRGHGDASLIAFHPGDELAGDYGNWFAPSEAALHGLCRAAGFRRVETIVGPPSLLGVKTGIRSRLAQSRAPRGVEYYRAVVHAFV